MSEQRIKELEDENIALRQRIIDNDEEIKRLAGELFGVKVGDIVLCKGKRFKVASIHKPWMFQKPYLMGFFEKSDGSFSSALRRAYSDWEVAPQ
jgi:hypothetical protein